MKKLIILLFFLPLIGFSQQTMEAINDSTVIRRTWLRIPATVIDTIPQLRIVVLRDTMLQVPGLTRVDTIRNIPDVDEFLDKLSLLPVYDQLGDSARAVIDDYLKRHYAIRKVLQVYD